MQSNDNKNAIIAVVLSGIILFGWNYFFPSEVYTPAKKVNTSENSTKDVKEDIKKNLVSQNEKDFAEIKDTIVVLDNGVIKASIDQNLVIKEFETFNSKIALSQVFEQYKNTLSIKRNNNKIIPRFSFEKINESLYNIKDGENNLSGTIGLNDLNYIVVKLNSSETFIPEYDLVSSDQEMDDGQKFNTFAFYGEGLDTVKVGEEDSETFEGKFKWYGLDFNYHFLANVIDSSKLYKAETKGNRLKLLSIEPTNTIEYKTIFLKKNYDDLKSVGSSLEHAVDFGMWGIIAVPILRGLQFLYTVLQNYGLAIIVLTIFIRLLTFPLQYKSFKSMKKMQVIQPELKKIKEKYKDNPQKVQQETMALFKKSGASPLGGCLPMILQMPIFFAFYKVLFTSVELVDAPFYFWIHDLSEKDPFYILPVLMGLAMFLNMKLTPNTSMDPAQQKMMMFMPVIFSLFMINLPAGLTLYILISTIMGMLQQLFVNKQTV